MITDFAWQEFQGFCPSCSFKFIDFLGEKTEKDFKYCVGFVEPTLDHYRQPYVPLKDFSGHDKLVLGFECPKCFLKSGFHVHKSWKEKYGKWIK